ncbi:hypothetical protein Tco_0172494 [Tanacetum coccineum]
MGRNGVFMTRTPGDDFKWLFLLVLGFNSDLGASLHFLVLPWNSMLEWSGDQVKLERWQGMVRERAARSDKDGLLGVQGEEVAFFLVPK